MSVNGENEGNGEGTGQPTAGGATLTPDDVIAQAEAAAQEAARAAEAARAKAEELAAQKQAATAQKPAAAPAQASTKAAPKAAEGDKADGSLQMVPNPDGIFDPAVVDEKKVENYTPEISVIDESKARKIGFVLFAVAAAAIAVSTVLIATSSEASTRVSKFFQGFECGETGRENCLVDYIYAEAREKEAQWREEDYRARPIYGDITLTYFPKDARVDIYQTMYLKDGAEWRADTAGLGELIKDCGQLLPEARKKQLSAAGHGDPTCNAESGEISFPNQSHVLKEGEYVERIPLRNLPIFQTERHPLCERGAVTCDEDTAGSVKLARNYEYRIVFSREGYEPHELKITKEGWTKGAGSSNYIYFWNGLDLQPKPETLRDNFILAKRQIFCLMQLQKIESYDKLPAENRDLIMSRNGFKSWEAFLEVEGVLTVGEFEAWWTEAWTEIQKAECAPEPAK
jgi:hypothetical protein